MYYVYVLQSFKDSSLYTGFTVNLQRRFFEHNNGLSQATKYLRPWKLIYYEAYCLENDAKGREVFLKSGSGKKYLDKQLKNYFNSKPRKKIV
ncbi:MAG: GIY-YIG nuclease family protein [Patescibacteria group bacterium]|jgi:putative endonuclease